MSEPTQIDWARLAAYIDGEGCIIIVKSNPGHFRMKSPTFHIRVSICNCDPRLLLWCKNIFAIGTIRPNDKRAKRWAYKWHVEKSQAEKILRGCLPYFVIKKEQAEIALALRETIRCFNKSWHGKELPAEEIQKRDNMKKALSSLKHLEIENVVPS